ncbi:MAG: hypothetical protein MAG453_01673 [Calditrichaeota bacterium]|nr:hypothetical protein [Calditrichota bacterium]
MLAGVSLVLVLLAVTPALAQRSDENPVKRIERYYQEGRLEKAELEAFHLLNMDTGLSDMQRAELYRILAFSAVAGDDTELARRYFRLALQHNPNLRLDRALTSPKILSVYDEARADFKQVRVLDRETLERRLASYRLRVQGGARSLLLPGLGQLHKGQRARGYLLLAAVGGCAAGLAYTSVMVGDSRDRYDSSTTPAAASEHYDDLLSYWRWRNGLSVALGVIWVGSALDAFLTPPAASALRGVEVGVSYDGRAGAVLAGLTVRF